MFKWLLGEDTVVEGQEISTPKAEKEVFKRKFIDLIDANFKIKEPVRLICEAMINRPKTFKQKGFTITDTITGLSISYEPLKHKSYIRNNVVEFYSNISEITYIRDDGSEIITLFNCFSRLSIYYDARFLLNGLPFNVTTSEENALFFTAQYCLENRKNKYYDIINKRRERADNKIRDKWENIYRNVEKEDTYE